MVITGASSGIGRTLAYWYLNHGAKVALVGRDIAELDNIGKNFPSQALVVQCDLTIDMQLLDMKTAVAEKFGGLDILINCAGKSLFSKLTQIEDRCDLRGMRGNYFPVRFRLFDGYKLQNSIRSLIILSRFPCSV